ncbi:hypothetical protein ACFC0E_39675, partial [Streptomyces sp. NPDC056190]
MPDCDLVLGHRASKEAAYALVPPQALDGRQVFRCDRTESAIPRRVVRRSARTVYEPGELAQCDLWFPPVDVPLCYGQSGRPPVLVIVSGYSRVITARMLPSRQTGDLIDG